MTTTLDEAYLETFIEIIARETGDVVTLIELLSPVNKIGDGRSPASKAAQLPHSFAPT